MINKIHSSKAFLVTVWDLQNLWFIGLSVKYLERDYSFFNWKSKLSRLVSQIYHEIQLLVRFDAGAIYTSISELIFFVFAILRCNISTSSKKNPQAFELWTFFSCLNSIAYRVINNLWTIYEHILSLYQTQIDVESQLIFSYIFSNSSSYQKDFTDDCTMRHSALRMH